MASVLYGDSKGRNTHASYEDKLLFSVYPLLTAILVEEMAPSDSESFGTVLGFRESYKRSPLEVLTRGGSGRWKRRSIELSGCGWYPFMHRIGSFGFLVAR
jgi:hypothetical protein